MFVKLKPVSERSEHGLAVIARLRPQLARVAGLQLFLQPVQDVRAGGRQSNATYQYTLKGDEQRRPAELVAQARRRTEDARRADRRQHRRPGKRRRDHGRGRPGRGGSARHQRPGRRRGALRRVRPAPGGDDLHRAEPVSRGDGMGAGVHAEPQRAGRRLCAGDVAGEQRRAGGRDRARGAGGIVEVDGRGQRRHGDAAGVAEPGAAQRVDRERAQQHPDHPGAAVDDRALRRGADRDLGQPPGHRARDDDLLQPRRRRDARGCEWRHRAGRGRHRHADDGARRIRRHRAAGAAVERRAGAADRRGAGRDLHRARRALRKPGAPGHRAVDAAVGGRRRRAGAADVQDGLLAHRADRRVPADRHRQEERDPDHRLRAGGRARARASVRSKPCARPACCASGRS